MSLDSMDRRNSVILRYLRSREIDHPLRWHPESRLTATQSFIDRLGLTHELAGHGGCVNCLEWNVDGSILASGSDDFHIMLWDPFRLKRLVDLDTGHQGNIFSVKFMPQSKDGLVATGAGDGKVKLHLVERAGSSEVGEPSFLQCTCHSGRVKRLAIAPDLPYMLWSGAEDGTVMQFDLRAPHDCNRGPSQILVNLLSHAGKHAEVKSIAINPQRTEQLAVGANDPYVRLYDRRMIKLTSVQFRSERPSMHWGRRDFLAENCRSEEDRTAIPIDCVQYFSPAHLQRKLEDYRRRFRSLASTYVTFDSSGRYLLANLGGEQIYLYDCSSPQKPITQTPLPRSLKEVNEGKTQNGHSCTANPCALPSTAEQLKSQANANFQQKQYTTAIGLYSKALLLAPKAGVLYSNRAAAYMKRNWDGDTYAALRDCYSAIKLCADPWKPLLRMARCLQDLGLSTSASEALDLYKEKYPAQSTSLSVKNLEKDIRTSTGRQQQQTSAKATGETTPPSTATDAPSEATVENADEHEEPRPRIVWENEEEAFEEDSSGGYSVRSRSISVPETRWRTNAWDYDQRFCGHCNTTTDIKEANFFGSDGQYIVAGSDDGCIFIWDRTTGIIQRILKGDDSIVNCLQPHPTTCLMATSGIDSVVRLWAPLPSEGRINDRIVQDTDGAAMANQRRMNADPFEMILMNMGPGEEVLGGLPTYQRRNRGRRARSPDRSDEEEDPEAHAAIQCRPS